MAGGRNAIRNVRQISNTDAVADAQHRPKFDTANKNTNIRSVTVENKSVSTPETRRITPDRTDLLHHSAVRNIRTSTMPGAPTTQKQSGRETVDEAFTAEYARKGIQPSHLESTTKDQTTAIDENEEDADISSTIEEDIAIQQKNQISAVQKLRKLRNLKNLTGGVKQAKAVTTTYSIWSWSVPFYISVQLPLTILSLFFLGIALAVDSILGTSSTETNKGFFESVWANVKTAVIDFLSTINTLTKYFFDIDLTGLHPGSIFITLHAALFGIFVFQLLIIYFIYKLAMINPILGEKSGIKLGMFLLALIGLAVPVANLLPWAFFWTLAVVKNPK